jgi:hypothetical protein
VAAVNWNEVLDDPVVSVNMVAQVMPDIVTLEVNGEHYASAARVAGPEALRRVEDLHAIAIEALTHSWTVREMNQAVARAQR